MLSVIEQFISLDGEGPTAGELAYFVRFAGCNLRCSWCDTAYSWDGTTQIQEKTAQQIYAEIKASGIRNVTLTGGEPLQQQDISQLLQLLAADDTLLCILKPTALWTLLPFSKLVLRRTSFIFWIISCPAAVWKKKCACTICSKYADRTFTNL